jgi:carboxypeptidase PM20D1
MNRITIRCIAAGCAAAAAISAVAWARTLAAGQEPPRPEAAAVRVDYDERGAAERLSEALRFRTVSRRDAEKIDYPQFEAFRRFLERSYPLVHGKLAPETINGYSLLYMWRGTDASLAPALIAAHLDTVDAERPELWRHGPFSGDIAEGMVWGRGARDNKGQLMAIMEAAEALLRSGLRPRRTIILAFGHDEETLGTEGAAKIAAVLGERKIRLECVVDEGGTVAERAVPGLKRPAALIGIAEKGYLTLRLTATGTAGHSADAQGETAIGILCAALARIEAHRFPSTLRYLEPTLRAAVPYAAFPLDAAFANLWLAGSVVERLAERSGGAAALRATAVATFVAAGGQDNVVPGIAEATVNLRLLPGLAPEDAEQEIRRIVDDRRIRVERVGYANGAPRPSGTNSWGYRTLSAAIGQTFPEAVCLPYFVTGGTDSKHYAALADDIYRFTPSRKAPDEEGHGVDERMPLDNYRQYVEFYANLISRLAAGSAAE